MCALIRITDESIDGISHDAAASSRMRSIYNYHRTYDDLLQRMLNALEPGSYVRPHKHENPDKTEVFLILRGRALAVEYDDRGEISDHFILDYRKGRKGVEVPPREWHSFIALTQGTVMYEAKTGPYDKKTDKVFAPWAPEENTPEGYEFAANVLRKLKVRVRSQRRG